MKKQLTVLTTTLLALTACTQGSFEGKLVNGLTGEPVPDMQVLLRGETTDLTCQVKEGTTDANGVVKIEGTCGDTEYKLELGKETWFTDTSAPTHTGGTASTGPVEVKVWVGPEGEAVYFMEKDGSFKSQKTYADVTNDVIGGTEQKIRYPAKQPSKDADWRQVPADGWVMITGQATIDRLQFQPAIENEPFPMGVEDPQPMKFPWHYIGMAVTPDGQFEVKTVQLDEAKFVNATDGGERVVRYIPAGAVPAGKYALLGEKDNRTYLMRFGDAPAEPEAPAEGGE
ncbi:MAG: hypothetical protein H6741_29575 [Alphaproteobacteria bacterium]|nr:hypothetical protein [Alphaproteobacteria bacterium]MCB9796872.1 hypothetical protein [Alphaproteobacteria bacterium]